MTPFSRGRISQGTTLLKNTNRKSYTIYRMVPFTMTFNQSIKAHFVKRHKSRANRRRVKRRARPSGYRKLWQKVPSLKHVWKRSQSWLTDNYMAPWVISDPDVKVVTFLKSNIVKTSLLKDKVQSINQSMAFVKRPLQNWTAALDRSTVNKIR